MVREEGVEPITTLRLRQSPPTNWATLAWCPKWESNPHFIVFETIAAYQLGYSGIFIFGGE